MTFVVALSGSLALVWLAFALWASFDTEGGANGQVPMVAHAFGVAIAAMLTWLFVERGWPRMSVRPWAHVPLFVLAVCAVGVAIHVAGRLGQRMSRRHGPDDRR